MNGKKVDILRDLPHDLLKYTMENNPYFNSPSQSAISRIRQLNKNFSEIAKPKYVYIKIPSNPSHETMGKISKMIMAYQHAPVKCDDVDFIYIIKSYPDFRDFLYGLMNANRLIIKHTKYNPNIMYREGRLGPTSPTYIVDREIMEDFINTGTDHLRYNRLGHSNAVTRHSLARRESDGYTKKNPTSYDRFKIELMSPEMTEENRILYNIKKYNERFGTNYTRVNWNPNLER
jgi:hypothetical protein